MTITWGSVLATLLVMSPIGVWLLQDSLRRRRLKRRLRRTDPCMHGFNCSLHGCSGRVKRPR